MKIISFAWTTSALLAGAKTVTRRNWDWNYALRFRQHEGVQAYDRSPRIGGKLVALIRLTEVPRLEPLSAAPDSDFEAEGFAWMVANDPIAARRFGGRTFLENPREWYQFWRRTGGLLWVVRFQLTEVVSKVLERLTVPEAR